VHASIVTPGANAACHSAPARRRMAGLRRRSAVESPAPTTKLPLLPPPVTAASAPCSSCKQGQRLKSLARPHSCSHTHVC
jgi:hypothetical protein